ncbi:5'-3' exoribonuclease 3-like [Vicia villosa]|uniref:5'-3' exoribonuclease 3-like n=1 Tax=Vicia villosa TaxID=3911 RepID=UPI00273B79B5|nr:5'-3' exoribonuclease 3-like [Vicia villosa]
MGVPVFYRWLIKKYPKIIEDANTNTTPTVEYDNLYIDMNSIIHPCFHPNDDNINTSPPTTFLEVFANMFDYIDHLVTIVKPRKLLYMAIDGVAPRGKMNQQRTRRFQAAKDNEMREAEEERLRKQYEMEGKQVLPKQECEVSDSNIITPGTEFMHQLSKALKAYISSRISSDLLWKDIMVILSDSNVPGEGEHKIMSFIRKQRGLPDYNPNTVHCLYGSDADLIMLGLSSHEPHFSILREVIKDPPNYYEKLEQNAAKTFKLLHIWLLREYLELDMKIQDPPKNFIYDFERIIDDFIFICFFAGNDFLPQLPSLDIYDGSIDLLMTVYKKEFHKLGGYLVDINKMGGKHSDFVKLSRVEEFILMVGTYEEKIFNKISAMREKKLRRLIRDHENSKQEEQDACNFTNIENGSSSDCAIRIKKTPTSYNVCPVSHEEILKNTYDLKEELKKCMKGKGDLFTSGDFLNDKIKLGAVGFKERYYKEKFSVDGSINIEQKRKQVVQKYTEGLLWLLEYYFSGVASWTWFYPFYYSPFASDFKGMSQVRVNFEKGVPFLPFDQLLSVLPQRSAYALPKAYAQLMLDEKSKIFDLFPRQFEVDIEGKRFRWMGVFKLPYIDERRLLAETRELIKGLSENEAMRNSVEVDRLLVSKSLKLAEKICSLSSNKLHTSISIDGIGGTISLCHNCVEDNNEEDVVFCVKYELPMNSTSRYQHLLFGVNLPDKTIFENDLMETVLWHERQQQYNRFERLHNQDRWRSSNNEASTSKFPPNKTTFGGRSSSLNASPEFIHKGAGVGWASGRGKPERINHETLNDRMSSFSPFHNQQSTDHGESYYCHPCSNNVPYGRGRGRAQKNSNNVYS